MAIPRGTTPTLILTSDNQLVDWTVADHIYVTFYQKSEKSSRSGRCCHDSDDLSPVLTKTEEDVDISSQSIAVFMSQEDTLRFEAGKEIYIQVNWTYGDGQRGATQLARIKLGTNLIGRVLE